MATKSKIVETAFRFGSGRYIQESGACSRLAEELARLGCRKPFIIGGKTALSLTLGLLSASLDAEKMPYQVRYYEGFCCAATCEELMAEPEYKECDSIVGVGGGNVCDAAKLMAARSDLPVILVPTSSATCACFTPLSVTYTKELRCAGSVHHKSEVNGVLADTDVLCGQPERLLAAGVYDAAAKLIEIEQRIKGKSEEEIDVGLASSYALSRYTYDRMFALFDEAVKGLNEKTCNKALYDLIYLTMGATGVISGMARGSNQCAIAHKVYENLRTLFPETVSGYLHGEMVAIGLLVQLYYNGRENEVEAFRAGMLSHGMPTRLADLGVEPNAENVAALFDKLVNSTAMAGTSKEEQDRLVKALQVIQ